MPSPPEEYASIFFSSLLQPIVDLFDLMDAQGSRGPNEVKAPPMENGYSVSIVVLSVFVLESALNRSRYVRSERGRKSATKALEERGGGGLIADAKDLFVLRDAIAHNHVWRATIQWDDDGAMRLLSAELLDGYGDAKFRDAVDLATRRTKRLGLDVFPTRIHRGTAIAVLKKCVEVLRFLEKQSERYVYLDPVHVFPRGANATLFYAWVDQLSPSA